MSPRRAGVVHWGGTFLLLAGTACSTPPRTSPDAAATVATSSPVRVPDAGVVSAPEDAGPPDPREAWHDAEALPLREANGLRPHALKVLLDDSNNVQGINHHDPYVSEDGSIAFVLKNQSSFDAKRALVVLLVRELDHPERDREMVVVDSPDCRVSPDPPPCDLAGAQASARKVNAFLAKHRWVEFTHFSPETPGFEGGYCGLTLRVRAAGYSFVFRSPRLQVTGPNGAVIIDRTDVTPAPAVDPPGQCPAARDATIGWIGISTKRRAMYVDLLACMPHECLGSERFVFFRLPEPSK